LLIFVILFSSPADDKRPRHAAAMRDAAAHAAATMRFIVAISPLAAS